MNAASAQWNVGGRISVLIATLAQGSLATALALIGRLNGQRPSSSSIVLLLATVLNVVCAMVVIVARKPSAEKRSLAWWLGSTIVLDAILMSAALGEAVSVWARLVFGLAIVATIVAAVQSRRAHPAD